MGQHKHPKVHEHYEYREYTLLVPKAGAGLLKQVSGRSGLSEHDYIRLAVAEKLFRDSEGEGNE